jgi:hypothetical protein
LNISIDASTLRPDTTQPTDRILKIADLKGAIKQLQVMLDDELDMLKAEIDLGLLEEFEEDGSVVYEGIRCTPVQTKRWEYDSDTKRAIKALQERAQHYCTATQKTTTSLRITF